MRHPSLSALAACVMFLMNVEHVRGQSIQSLNLLPSTVAGRAYELSSNGGRLAGVCYPQSANGLPTQWNSPSTPTALSLLPGDTWGVAFGISGDGSTAVGESVSGGTYSAVRWTASGIQNLGLLPGSLIAAAYSASFDGSVIVGTSSNLNTSNAFRWTASGMQDLGRLPGTSHAVAQKVTSDGSIVVGRSDNRAFRWSQSTGMQELPIYPGGGGTDARAVSADGSRIAGRLDLAMGGPDRAALWTAGTVLALDPLSGYSRSEATGISPDGRFVVGLSGGFPGNRATIWDIMTSQMSDLRSFLVSNGFDLTGWNLESVDSMTGDNILGYNIVGGGIGPSGPTAYLVTGLQVPIPEPSSLILLGGLAALVGARRIKPK